MPVHGVLRWHVVPYFFHLLEIFGVRDLVDQSRRRLSGSKDICCVVVRLERLEYCALLRAGFARAFNKSEIGLIDDPRVRVF